jgi:predicted porin
VTIGGTALFGPVSVTVDISHDTKRVVPPNNLGINNTKLTNGLLEAKYSFSKRTFVYAAYLHRDRTNNYGLGLRHNF